ncbi:MAG: hypothetical protein H7839_24475, partial [Magnetococcus sp. YQC-5]
GDRRPPVWMPGCSREALTKRNDYREGVGATMAGGAHGNARLVKHDVSSELNSVGMLTVGKQSLSLQSVSMERDIGHLSHYRYAHAPGAEKEMAVYTKFYIMDSMKPVRFIESAREDLATFPEAVRRIAGLNLWRVQCGLMPLDWKPMPEVGAGAMEIRIHLDGA